MNALVGVFSAVNESVWEHLKLPFWPSFLWTLLVIVPLSKSTGNFWVARAAATFAMVFLIPVIFYSYTWIVGESILAVDIGSFVIAVFVGQLMSYRLMQHSKLASGSEKIAVIALVALAASFVVLTFYPLHLPIFQDPITGGYGIGLPQ